MEPATVLPWVTYADAHAAIDFLQRAFGGEPMDTADDGSSRTPSSGSATVS